MPNHRPSFSLARRLPLPALALALGLLAVSANPAGAFAISSTLTTTTSGAHEYTYDGFAPGLGPCLEAVSNTFNASFGSLSSTVTISGATYTGPVDANVQSVKGLVKWNEGGGFSGTTNHSHLPGNCSGPAESIPGFQTTITGTSSSGNLTCTGGDPVSNPAAGTYKRVGDTTTPTANPNVNTITYTFTNGRCVYVNAAGTIFDESGKITFTLNTSTVAPFAVAMTSTGKVEFTP